MLKSRRFRRVLMVYLSIGVIGVIGLFLFLQAGMASAANGQAATDEGMEILTRGPIHEAFADVSVDEAQPGIIVSTRRVPDPINEIPPDFRPEGDHVEWISGYWSWDEDHNDYIWVSGIWRDVPPGRQWIPGYWTPVESGYQYISGFWTDENQTETVYLPPPPKPLQASPSSPSLSPYHVWTEGHWIWFHDRYAWQAGYWLEQRPDMVWIPAHYVWSPRGHIFVRGYWDYQLARRGVIFAPRYYAHPIYRNHGYYYTPSIVLNIDAIFLSLFIRDDSHHYYFGDYFDDRYKRRGFHPWYSKHATRYGYDPYYRSYRLFRLRNDSQWEHKYHQQFQYRHDHRDARPPVIYRRQKTNHNFDRSHGPTNQMIGKRLTDIVKSKDQPLRYTRLNSNHRKVFQAQDKKLNTFQVKRREHESVPDRERKFWKPAHIKKPVQKKISASPIKAKTGRTTTSRRPQGKSRVFQQGKTQEHPRYKSQIELRGNQYQKQKNQTGVQLQTKPRTKQHLRQQYQPQVVLHQIQLEQLDKQPQKSQDKSERQPRKKQQQKKHFQRQEQSER